MAFFSTIVSAALLLLAHFVDASLQKMDSKKLRSVVPYVPNHHPTLQPHHHETFKRILTSTATENNSSSCCVEWMPTPECWNELDDCQNTSHCKDKYPGMNYTCKQYIWKMCLPFDQGPIPRICDENEPADTSSPSLSPSPSPSPASSPSPVVAEACTVEFENQNPVNLPLDYGNCLEWKPTPVYWQQYDECQCSSDCSVKHPGLNQTCQQFNWKRCMHWEGTVLERICNPSEEFAFITGEINITISQPAQTNFSSTSFPFPPVEYGNCIEWTRTPDAWEDFDQCQCSPDCNLRYPGWNYTCQYYNQWKSCRPWNDDTYTRVCERDEEEGGTPFPTSAPNFAVGECLEADEGSALALYPIKAGDCMLWTETWPYWQSNDMCQCTSHCTINFPGKNFTCQQFNWKMCLPWDQSTLQRVCDPGEDSDEVHL